MAGQIIKRGERKWLLRVDLGRDEAGKRQRMNKTVHGTKKEAQKILNEMLGDKDRGTLITESRESLNSYLDRWLETAAKPKVREDTFKGYATKLRIYIRPPLGDKQLQRISALDIQKVYADMQARDLSANTVHHAHKILRNALQQAVKWRLIPSNPADLVELPKLEHNEMLAMNQEEAQRFLSAAKTNRWHALFALMLSTGLRPSEALALKWEDIDFQRHVIRVQRKLTRVKGGFLFEPPKTKRSRRVVDFPVNLTDVLLEHQARQAELGEIDPDLSLVFAGETGQPAHERNILKRHYRPLLKAADLPLSLRLYDLRHTHATLLLLAGVHPKVVSERLGHSSISITLDTYSHVLPTMQKESAAKLNDMLFTEGVSERVYN